MDSNLLDRDGRQKNYSRKYRKPYWYRKTGSLVGKGLKLSQIIISYIKKALTGRLVRVPISCVTNEYAFSMAPDGWNYFRALIAEYENDPGIELEDSTFFRYFQDEQIRSVRYFTDLLFLHDPEKRLRQEAFKFFFDTAPWGGWNKDDDIHGGKPWGSYYDRVTGSMTRDRFGYHANPWYEPGDRYPLEIEWDHCIQLYHSIVKKGYHPLWYDDFPRVSLLIRSNGEMRAVNHDGQHRLSILSHLGHAKLTVEIAPDSVGVIREAEVEQWYYVKNGLCTPEQALEIFNAYFALNGRERIEYLGLPSVY